MFQRSLNYGAMKKKDAKTNESLLKEIRQQLGVSGKMDLRETLEILLERLRAANDAAGYCLEKIDELERCNDILIQRLIRARDAMSGLARVSGFDDGRLKEQAERKDVKGGWITVAFQVDQAGLRELVGSFEYAMEGTRL